MKTPAGLLAIIFHRVPCLVSSQTQPRSEQTYKTYDTNGPLLIALVHSSMKLSNAIPTRSLFQVVLYGPHLSQTCVNLLHNGGYIGLEPMTNRLRDCSATELISTVFADITAVISAIRTDQQWSRGYPRSDCLTPLITNALFTDLNRSLGPEPYVLPTTPSTTTGK